MKNGFVIIICAGLVCLTSCGKRAGASSNASNDTAANSVTPKIDACTLLTGAEIEEIETSPLKDTKGNSQASGGLQTSQCFFATNEFNRSVSLSVSRMDPNSSSKRTATSYWEDVFGRYRNGEKEKDSGKAGQSDADKEKRESLGKQRGEEEEAVPPKKVSGVGDEAFWSGNRVGGALYVLSKKNDAFIRVSVGGPDPEESKIEKSKQLAIKALARL